MLIACLIVQSRNVMALFEKQIFSALFSTHCLLVLKVSQKMMHANIIHTSKDEALIFILICFHGKITESVLLQTLQSGHLNLSFSRLTQTSAQTEKIRLKPRILY